MYIPLSIDKGMVIRHEETEPLQILIIDAIVELERDEFWIFCVHLLTLARARWRRQEVRAIDPIREGSNSRLP